MDAFLRELETTIKVLAVDLSIFQRFLDRFCQRVDLADTLSSRSERLRDSEYLFASKYRPELPSEEELRLERERDRQEVETRRASKTEKEQERPNSTKNNSGEPSGTSPASCTGRGTRTMTSPMIRVSLFSNMLILYTTEDGRSQIQLRPVDRLAGDDDEQ